jgi:hypothetical protein
MAARIRPLTHLAGHVAAVVAASGAVDNAGG